MYLQTQVYRLSLKEKKIQIQENQSGGIWRQLEYSGKGEVNGLPVSDGSTEPQEGQTGHQTCSPEEMDRTSFWALTMRGW